MGIREHPSCYQDWELLQPGEIVLASAYDLALIEGENYLKKEAPLLDGEIALQRGHLSRQERGLVRVGVPLLCEDPSDPRTYIPLLIHFRREIKAITEGIDCTLHDQDETADYAEIGQFHPRYLRWYVQGHEKKRTVERLANELEGR